MVDESIPICDKCHVKLGLFQTDFSYMGHNFHANVLRCPECGQIHLKEEFVRGRMAEVEYLLEDK